jgi:hypothetical protein
MLNYRIIIFSLLRSNVIKTFASALLHGLHEIRETGKIKFDLVEALFYESINQN